MLQIVLRFFDERIQRFGAAYLTFAIYGLINYPLTYIVRVYCQNLPDTESFGLRVLPTILCLVLLVKDYWPRKLKRFLALYWFLTVTLSLSLIMAYLLLKNNFSLEWLINVAVGLLITMLVLDWVMSVLSVIIGTIIGYAAFVLQYGHINFHSPPENIYVAAYLYSMIILFCAIFLRNKEAFHVANKTLLDQMVKEKSDQLNKAVIMKDIMLTRVNHEVRTPVHVISNLAEALLKDSELLSKAQKLDFIDQIFRNSTRLLDLVTNWMEVVSLSSNKRVQFDMQKHNLLTVVNNAVKDVEVLAAEKSIEIICAKQRNSAEYIACFHDLRIEQIIKNLCTNAMKFSPKGSKVIVDVCKYTWEKENGQKVEGLCVSVEDGGPGINKEDMETIFDAFTQAHDAKNQAGDVGVGLGLAIAKEIIVGHGGKIWVENNKDKPGCTFSFFIPYDQVKAVINVEGAKVVLDKSHSKVLNIKRPLNILFLDDEETNCVLGKMMLEQLGHRVEAFTDPEAFFRTLKDNAGSIDLIFVDMVMPVSGMDIIKEIKANKLCKDIPILVQSGIVNDAELTSVLSLKKVGFIIKPYNVATITEAIDKILQDEHLEVHN